MTTPLRQRPAWKALEAHYREIKEPSTCASCSPTTPGAANA